MNAAQVKREDPDWVKMAARAHVHYRVPGMEQVATRTNVPFKSADGDPLLFDLYSPVGAGAGVQAPAVMLIHGGPIPANLLTSPKDWGLFQSLARLIAASGLAAVMFNHRFFGFDRIRDPVADIDDLLTYVAAHGRELGIDAGRLCLWAFSGGGVFLGPFVRNTPDAIRCVVAYYAALHARTPEFSAAAHLSENAGKLPALLVARAGLDLPELNDGIDHFIQQALKKNACIDVLNHPTGQHGFDVRDDNARTRDILRRTLEFIQIHVSA